MPYEQGMRVEYDPISKEVHVTFRGERALLAETFDTLEAGTAAGEKHCRRQGWKG